MGDRTLLLGYDLCDDKTQMAVYNRTLLEPELVGQTDDNPDALIETMVQVEDAEPIRDFLTRIRKGRDIRIDGRTSKPINVLAHFFRKTLSLTRQKYPNDTIKQLVVTIPHQSPKFVRLIYEALEMLGIEKDRAIVISHKQSFLYYVLYQKKELWVNDVGMFDYDGKNLHYYQMQVDRTKKPILTGVLEKDYTEAMSVAYEDISRRGAAFEDIVYGAIHKQILSSLYMTGDGFEDEWTDVVFKKLCVGRRLFKGRNLYVSGACYAAKEIGEKSILSDYLLLDEEMITSQVSIPVYANAKQEDVVLAKAGMPWFQVDESVDLIPDGENELTVCVKNVFTDMEKKFMIDLEPVMGKVNRHCRLTVRIRFADVKTCVVTVKDRGFGEIFPTSNRIWEKTLLIEN